MNAGQNLSEREIKRKREREKEEEKEREKKREREREEERERERAWYRSSADPSQFRRSSLNSAMDVFHECNHCASGCPIHVLHIVMA